MIETRELKLIKSAFPEFSGNFDRETVLNLLREKFKKAAEKFGERFFNLKELESRITHMITSRVNLAQFVKDEIYFYVKLEEKALQKEHENKKKEELNKKLEEIMAANNELIEKYPDRFIDNLASYEIRKFSGAISEFIDNNYPVIRAVLRGTIYWNELEAIFGDLERFYQANNRGMTMFLKHYIDEVTEKSEDERDNIERKLLQTGGLYLYRLHLLLKKAEDEMSDEQKFQILKIPAHFAEELKSSWKNLTFYSILGKNIEKCFQIVDDFRLISLVEHAYERDAKHL
ncbi:MAG: hypothetical protein OEZ13_09435 [Spirochaetia bacterium]|nr:hypothetical protein [Spirochaetia bacterium]